LHQILLCASQDRPKREFLSDVMKLILEHSGCDAVETWLNEGAGELRCEAYTRMDEEGAFTVVPPDGEAGGQTMAGPKGRPDMGKLYAAVLDAGPACGYATCIGHGSVWIHNPRRLFSPDASPDLPIASGDISEDGGYPSLALVPLRSDRGQIGLLAFKGRKGGSFDPGMLEHLEAIAAKFELALHHRFLQAKLHERVKELACLYGIARAASEPGLSFEQKMMSIVALLPRAWQYPAHARGRIVIEGRAYQDPLFAEGTRKQTAPVTVKGGNRGAVEVHYPGQRPFSQGNPFLDEEQSLINNVAGQIAQMIEQRETEAMQKELEDQMARTDRLAAIGQLAAGVAHELNEPLNAVLGFAQLIQKTENMPGQARHDIGKIVEAALHARNIVRELLINARQAAPSWGSVDLNRVIEDELSLFESLCAKSSVDLRRMLAPGLPEITVNKSRMLQVISNLIINALQAMPQGGVLTLATSFDDGGVSLVVEDTGVGMSDDVKKNIFLPFFTTRDVDQGTGLGLAVVHGIVASHSGRISVESAPGKGARFLLTFPYSEAIEPEED